jgi:hypothetical protein
MINSITGAPPPSAVALPKAKCSDCAPKTATPTQDSVSLSHFASAALKAKPAEYLETFTQTMQEAAAGDPKALAKLEKKS